ncbi:RNA-directed DNA polymerase, eukaryota [Tanacetum coccineum]
MESDSSPALVLDDECLYSKDLSNSLLGRVKEFASLSDLKMALTNEGFDDTRIQYMGELRVLLGFALEDSKILFHDNVGAGSWFSQLKQASMEFNSEGELLHIDDQEDNRFHSKRICIYTKFENIFEAFKIIFRGKVFWIRVKEAPGWVPDFLEESEDEDESDDGSKEGDSKVHDMGIYGGDSDVEEVPETLFDERGKNNNKLDEASTGQQENHSEDPFSIYTLLKKKKYITEKDNNTKHSLKYPLGFTPNDGTDALCKNVEDSRNTNGENSHGCNVEEVNTVFNGNCSNKGSKEDVAESVCSGHFKKLVAPHTGGSLLSLMDELVKVGQTMGYKMDGCMSNMTEIIKSQGAKEVNFLVLQETKMESMKIFSIKMCWGNFAFDYVHSDSVGVWLKTGKDLLIVAVYAPHDFKDKQVLFGSVFNVQGANVFNSFIANAGLEEVPLGGSSFTWCHKSATKMSKLDRFLISESLLSACPNFIAITLERYLSDHQPILLRESHFDYGPTPFRFFHYWFEMDGFNKLVEDTWSEAPGDDSNAMTSMMKKLKYLKMKIRE